MCPSPKHRTDRNASTRTSSGVRSAAGSDEATAKDAANRKAPSAPLNILAVDDDPLIHAALARILGRQGFHVRACRSAAEALRVGVADAYDVVVLDVGLRDESGITVCTRLRDAGYVRGIIMLSGLHAPSLKAQALRAGADDYVTKPFHSGELVARIEALVRRVPVRRGPLLEVEGRTVRVGGAPVRLSATEREILLRIHEAGSSGVPKSALLDLVRAADPEHAVHVHISRIRKKLALAGWHLRLDDGRFRIQPPAR
jgi:DNA-binding response OmpR family regulator